MWESVKKEADGDKKAPNLIKWKIGSQNTTSRGKKVLAGDKKVPYCPFSA